VVEARLRQHGAQQAAGRADEGSSLHVLRVAGLLPDEHRSGAGPPLAEHDLRGVSPQIAATARLRLPRGGGELACPRPPHLRAPPCGDGGGAASDGHAR
jgi:hypothetical protein